MHELRRIDVLRAEEGFELVESGGLGQGITARDVRAVNKTLSGLLKLMYPNAEVTDEQLEELLFLAIEGRQRGSNQLHLMAPGEYHPVRIAARMADTGRLVAPTLGEAGRKQHVEFAHTTARGRGHRPRRRRRAGCHSSF